MTNETTEKKTTKQIIIDTLKETVETVLFVVVMVIIIRFFIGEIRWIPSASMHPTLIEGDRLFVERYSRFYSEPQRGDIIVFYPPETKIKNSPIAVFSRLTGFFCKDVAYIKRVVGIPGDRISIKRNSNDETYVYVNGEKLDEQYVKDIKATNYFCTEQTPYCDDVIVPDDMYFMLGDNRAHSLDSRYWGFLAKDRVIGRAVFRFWPLTRIKHINKPQY